jgi:uncharacterized membrane protein YfcA
MTKGAVVLSHLCLLLLFALVVATFFALLWRRDRRGQVRLFLQLFVGMVVGGLVVAWLMYPLPAGPPAPFP